ncbi:MAG: tetraacyldisaccharide 4'-kinase [Muribaculaceae bacterium]|nr:tetraacyldisaccharide 4'-kinase [Muribaculaceae bacterium]
MTRRTLLSKLVLLPCSKIYGAITYTRNKLFDMKVLKQTEFDTPIVCVGNLAVGGTGKTPLVEYIAGEFRKTRNVAVLSRGYRRSTKGFIMAGRTSTPRDIGDEAFQIYHKFGGKVTVAVCEDRVFGINEIKRLNPSINLIILDDGFQHRYVKPTVSVVVSEYTNPVYRDSMLPYGRLREPKRGINRADVVVVSKCPENMRPMDYRLVVKYFDLFPSQYLFFSHFEYMPLEPVFPDMAMALPFLDYLTPQDSILAVAGIGNPRPFVKRLKSFAAKVKVDVFPDHHNYTKKDIEHILARFKSLKGNQRIIVTTEKDAVRLACNPYYPYELKAHTYYLPVEVNFDTFEEGPDLIEVIEKQIAAAGL